MAHCYWHDALADAAVGDLITLTGEEAHHAAVVSRMRRGERVLVSDGLGVLAEGVIDRAERDGVDVVLQHVQVVPAPTPRIGLAQALAKGDRAELAVQASTELGVDAIVPWQARRSVVQWKGERGEKSLERWRKVVREAGKQAIRAAPAGRRRRRRHRRARRPRERLAAARARAHRIRLRRRGAARARRAADRRPGGRASTRRSSRRSPPRAPCRRGWATTCCAPRPRASQRLAALSVRLGRW